MEPNKQNTVLPEKLDARSVRMNYNTRPASYLPGSQAVHGRNGAVVLIGSHPYVSGCCERPENEHLYIQEKVR